VSSSKAKEIVAFPFDAYITTAALAFGRGCGEGVKGGVRRMVLLMGVIDGCY
jgi:hypothetical protein